MKQLGTYFVCNDCGNECEVGFIEDSPTDSNRRYFACAVFKDSPSDTDSNHGKPGVEYITGYFASDCCEAEFTEKCRL